MLPAGALELTDLGVGKSRRCRSQLVGLHTLVQEDLSRTCHGRREAFEPENVCTGTGWSSPSGFLWICSVQNLTSEDMG